MTVCMRSKRQSSMYIKFLREHFVQFSAAKSILNSEEMINWQHENNPSYSAPSVANVISQWLFRNMW